MGQYNMVMDTVDNITKVHFLILADLYTMLKSPDLMNSKSWLNHRDAVQPILFNDWIGAQNQVFADQLRLSIY